MKDVLQVNKLGVTFTDGSVSLEALRQVTFSIAPQEFICLLGPSGSGKSTLLRVLAGLVNPTAGEVIFSTATNGHRSARVGLVFQQANLMPWRSALENITLPLELQGVPKDEARERAQEMISLINLQGFENEWPRNLSGGMAQRVALGRALIQDPDLLLLDEPFGSLDALTRDQMGSELLRIWQAKRKTVLMVTHSISEAVYLSDRVLVLSPRPGNIRFDLPIDLPRPRLDEARFTPHFQKLARRLKGEIG
jgi:NitT/TauT family transport system ATP-binding protein